MKLTEAVIQKYANAQSWERGHEYYHDGYVGEVVRRGTRLSGYVEGSHYEPYQVQITLGEDDIVSAECTCPYDVGGYCKHIVATLLYYLHTTDEIEERPTLAVLLAELSTDDLRHIIIGLANDFSGLTEAVEQKVAWLKTTPALANADSVSPVAIDLTAIRRELRKDFSLAGSSGRTYDYWGEEEAEIYPDEWLSPHLEKVGELLDADEPELALQAIVTIIEAWIDGLGQLDEWVYEYNEDTLSETASELGATLAEILLSLPLTPAEQAEWQKRIAYWEKTVPELEIATTAVTHGWEYPPLVAAMQGHISEKGAWDDEPPMFADELSLARLRILARQKRYEEYIHLAEAEGETALYVYMLAQIGQTEKAVSEAIQYLTLPNEILQLAQILMDQGQVKPALTVAEHGLSLEDARKTELGRWLRNQAERSGRHALSLQAAQVAFQSSWELVDYQAVEKLAGDKWAELKPVLLSALAESRFSSNQIDIYLYENMLVEAMHTIDDHGFYTMDLERVVTATQGKYPDWGIAKYKAKGEAIMDASKAKNYDVAVSWVRKARDIYLEHGRHAEWDAYLNGLLDEHQRKYKLVPMLKAVRR